MSHPYPSWPRPEFPDFVTIEALLERRKDPSFFFLDVVLDASSQHGDDGTESWRRIPGLLVSRAFELVSTSR
jgi:hypothetical protein